MSVERVITCIIGGLFQGLYGVSILKIQMKVKINNFFLYLLLSLYNIVSLLFIPNQFRFLYCLFLTVVTLRYIFNLKDRKVLLYSFNMMILVSIVEIIVSILLVLCGMDSSKIVNNNFYNLLANILISIVTIIVSFLPFVKTLLTKLINIFDKNKKLINYLYIFIAILYLIVLKNGLEFLLKSNYYINIFFIIGVVLILTIIIKNELKYEQINEHNKQMLNYVTKYEKIIAEQGKANHEFKNQLMVIRGYAQMKSPKIIEYIDSITEDANKTHSSYLISQLNKFPDGGIKGLLYYKLSTMDDEKIKYEINVNTGIKSNLNSLGTNMYKNITKILGVLLDNAIDASKKAKDKKIIISVEKEKSVVVFNIYNTYKGKIDLSKIGTGYSTKGKGHGYGLRLVKDIISDTKIFSLENEIEDNYYVSKFSIELPNKKKK